MHVGHFATGLIGKRVDPKLSVGTMILASMLSDVLWCVFMLAGVEEVQITNGRGAGNYFHPINIALSHSLAMLVVWARSLPVSIFRGGEASAQHCCCSFWSCCTGHSMLSRTNQTCRWLPVFHNNSASVCGPTLSRRSSWRVDYGCCRW